MELKTQQSAYVEKLKDLYSVENQLLRVLPKMAKVASTPELRSALTEQLHQTQVHVHRLDRIFLRLGVGPKGNNCATIENLIAEFRRLMGEEMQAAALDAAVIEAAQRFEHFAITGYESAHASAADLTHNYAAESLRESLDEKESTVLKLKELAEPAANMGGHASNSKR